MTATKIGYGIELSYCATSSGSYVTVAELLEMTPPAASVDEVKVYRSDNAAAVVEKIPGWTEYSDSEITCTYTAATRTALDALVGTPYFFKVTYPKLAGQVTTGDVDAFAGFIKSLNKETPLKAAMTIKIKMAINGAVTYTVGT